MSAQAQAQLEAVYQEFRAGHFEAATEAMVRLVRASAAGNGGRPAIDVVTALTTSGWLRPVFARVQDAQGADGFYLRLGEVLAEHLGHNDPAVAAARRSTETIRAFANQTLDSLRPAEQAYEALTRQHGPDDSRVQIARDNLAIQYRNLGRPDLAAALYAALDVCEHLRPVKNYILTQGGTISSVGSPWSRNCRRWMYFSNVVLDADALRQRFALPEFIVTHTHLGTHDGHEQGLVCEQHQDALMGPHPTMAGAGVKVVG